MNVFLCKKHMGRSLEIIPINTLKQSVGNLPTNCLSVFDHFVVLALKGLNISSKICFSIPPSILHTTSFPIFSEGILTWYGFMERLTPDKAFDVILFFSLIYCYYYGFWVRQILKLSAAEFIKRWFSFLTCSHVHENYKMATKISSWYDWN